MVFISKSKYLVGLQCPKLLWIHYNAKDDLPPVDDTKQAIFDQGHEVGERAKKVFPEGVDIPWTASYSEVISKSKEMLSKRIPLFEAGFQYKNAYSRIDVLRPVGEDEWDIIEVKSATKIDPLVNYDDVSFQKYCCEGAGLKIRKCFLMHINKEFVKNGEIDPNELFVIEDISEQVDDLSPFVEEKINIMTKFIEGDKPDIPIGPQCNSPYDCVLKDVCWAFLPKDNVFELARIGKKGFDLLNEGIQEIKDIPPGFKLTGKQVIQKDAVSTNSTYVDTNAIKAFLGTLEYPIQYFDFETFNPAIPIYNGMRPYQHIPFQFSLHIQKEDGSVQHFEYLHEGKEDPRPKLLETIKKSFLDSGSVVVYYQSFEKGKLMEMAEAFPQYEPWIKSVLTRFVDLYQPFFNCDYYNPVQKGSASLKATMPALTGKGYDELEIADGGMAMRAYTNITFGEVDEEEKKAIRQNMLIYCGQDTEGMIWIINKLRDISEND